MEHTFKEHTFEYKGNTITIALAYDILCGSYYDCYINGCHRLEIEEVITMNDGEDIDEEIVIAILEAEKVI